jgi:hypothetical protein
MILRARPSASFFDFVIREQLRHMFGSQILRIIFGTAADHQPRRVGICQTNTIRATSQNITLQVKGISHDKDNRGFIRH